MKRLALLVVPCVALITLPMSAHAQAVPPPQARLAAALNMVRHTSGVHLAGEVTVSSGPVHARILLAGDVAPVRHEADLTLALRLASGGKTGRVVSTQARAILVGNRLALRTGNGPFKCRPITQIPGQYKSALTMLHFGVGQAQAAVPAILNGMNTYQIQTTSHVSILGTRVPLAAKLYITRPKGRLVAEIATTHLALSGNAVKLHEVLLLTKYGEHANIVFPSCGTTGGTGRG
ncbi:MAG: hypothetical protein ACRDFS_05030 [Chloroflexota bacterium]